MPKPTLSTYQQKRDFSRTPEPAGRAVAADGYRFVVHKHAASSDHYDLRLELGGVLRSWAVPKGPSLNPADKRYAAQTEDHPVEYLDFEGVIPEGEYGGGPMIVWDTGTWAPMGDADEGLRSGDFKFRLWGEKLKGGWMLVRLKGKPADKPSWLFFKERDQAADAKLDILAERPESVKSGLRIEELVAPRPATEKRKPPPTPGKAAGAVKAVLPETMKPQLASESESVVIGDGWLHEIKYDGYRTIALVEKRQVRLLTRSGLDWTERYGVLARAFADLPVKSAAIDGEIVVVDAQGISHFADLQQALSDKASERLTFFAFDLMHLDGYDLSAVRLDRRKALLQNLLTDVVTPNSAIQFSDGIVGEAQALYDHATELGLEGIVSKRLDAPYVQARSKTWVKTKARKVTDFAVVGYTLSPAAAGIGALALGETVDGTMLYRGKCGTGFSNADLTAILARLEPQKSAKAKLPGMTRDVIPVRPEHTVRVHYSNLTADGSVRHAVFKGFVEPEAPPVEPRPASAPSPRRRLISDADLAGIWVTNPTRKLFDDPTGPAKLDVAVYYAAVGDFMLPHLFGRPVSLVRSPSGKLNDMFFQRHPFTGMPPTIGSFETMSSEEGELKHYISVEDAKGYLSLAQFGVIEFHAWGCHWAKALEMPDRVIFDLDPGEGVPFPAIVDAAFVVRDFLQNIGLVPYVKTSGGKGLHVVVPLKPKLDWKAAHEGTGKIAAAIADEAPETFVVNMAKVKRTRRIFIDFHRNGRGATAVAPYSLRARKGLPASTPVNWSDLKSIDAPDDLNYSTLPGILNNSGDPWAAMDQDAADLGAALKQPRVLRRS